MREEGRFMPLFRETIASASTLPVSRCEQKNTGKPFLDLSFRPSQSQGGLTVAQTQTQPRSSGKTATRENQASQAQPILSHKSKETQPFGTLIRIPLGLDEDARRQSVEAMNQVLADTMSLRDMYKKHHWQVSGVTFEQLHLLFDKHHAEQVALVDLLAERIMALGGVSVAMPHDIVEMTHVPRPPRGREDVPSQLNRLLEAHEIVLRESRESARKAAENGDDGTNDLLVSDVVRTNELQVWFLAQHLVETPLIRSEKAVPDGSNVF
jgi:starvation-inducible DNA-binding protein